MEDKMVQQRHRTLAAFYLGGLAEPKSRQSVKRALEHASTELGLAGEDTLRKETDVLYERACDTRYKLPMLTDAVFKIVAQLASRT